MKSKFFASFFVLLILVMASAVYAHGTSAAAGETKELGNYEITFSTIPDYPVVGRETEILVEIHDESLGRDVSGLDVRMEIHDANEREVFSGAAHEEEEAGLYGVHYTFQKSGEYEIHAAFADKETEFMLEVDSLGTEGTVQLVVVLGLILFMLIFIEMEYRKKGKEK